MDEHNCQYKEAIEWIENEIRTNGVFSVDRVMTDSYDHETKTTTRVPNGRLRGFTVASQHTRGDDHNLLQLILTMKSRQKEIKRP